MSDHLADYKKSRGMASILAFSLAFVCALTTHSQFLHDVAFEKNPGNLEMSLYLPSAGLDSTDKIPLVVALHGCSQDGKILAEQSGWNELADKYHFAVLYPAQKRLNNPSNCFNWFELDDIQPDTGETASIVNMVHHALANYPIDSSMIFAYGLSAGAGMCVSLLANYPGFFKAGATFAGGPFKLATTKREGLIVMLTTVNRTPEEWGKLIAPDSISQSYPKLILCHGEKDKTVPIQYSYELIEQWTYLHQVDTIPDRVEENFEDIPFVNRLGYMDAAGNEKIIFYTFSSLGHALPVDPGPGKKQGGALGVFARDIDFFSTYYIAREFGLVDLNE